MAFFNEATEGKCGKAWMAFFNEATEGKCGKAWMAFFNEAREGKCGKAWMAFFNEATEGKCGKAWMAFFFLSREGRYGPGLDGLLYGRPQDYERNENADFTSSMPNVEENIHMEQSHKAIALTIELSCSRFVKTMSIMAVKARHSDAEGAWP
jgi:uncharacterized low-complexity protein